MVLGLLNVLNYLSIVVHLIGYVRDVRDVTYPGNGICGAFYVKWGVFVCVVSWS